MIQLIIGEKGKGKTKVLLDRANTEIKNVNGNIVYIDKCKQHMFELNNRVRLIDVSDYLIESSDAFLGFLCGVISQDNDLEQIYLDSFLKLMKISEDLPAEEFNAQAAEALKKINTLGEKYHISFVVSASIIREQVPEELQAGIIHE